MSYVQLRGSTETMLTIAPATIDRQLKVERGKLDPRERSAYQTWLTAQGLHSDAHLG